MLASFVRTIVLPVAVGVVAAIITAVVTVWALGAPIVP